MENDEEVRKSLTKVEEELDNLEQNKLPKSFSNINVAPTWKVRKIWYSP